MQTSDLRPCRPIDICAILEDWRAGRPQVMDEYIAPALAVDRILFPLFKNVIKITLR